LKKKLRNKIDCIHTCPFSETDKSNLVTNTQIVTEISQMGKEKSAKKVSKVQQASCLLSSAGKHVFNLFETAL